MPRIAPVVPSYQRQKRKGRADTAYVRIGRTRVPLGVYGSAESKEKYERVIAQARAAGGRATTNTASLQTGELVARYIDYANEYYRLADGTTSSQVDHIKVAVESVRKLYGKTLARDFGPKALKAVRQTWIDADKSRRTCNDYQAIVLRMFRWATHEELVPGGTYEALRALPGLRKGRTTARETEPVRPVPVEHVEAVYPFVSRQVAAMIRLQLLTGMRSGEAVIMRPVDLDMTGKVWLYKPMKHKSQHFGHDRTVYLGPRAQEVVRPFLQRAVDAYLFDPREAIAEAAAECETHRQRWQRPNPKKTSRVVGDRYSRDSYRRAIAKACKKADVPNWHPHQLRHAAGTNARKEYGLEAAQLLLGHARCDVTQVYAEVNQAKAIAVAQKIG